MEITIDEIKMLYRLLLNREGDEAGLLYYHTLAIRTNIDNLFILAQYIIQSDEFCKLHGFHLNGLNRGSSHDLSDVRQLVRKSCDPNWIDDTLEFYKHVDAAGIKAEELERVYKENQISLDEYYLMHSPRFRELFGWLKNNIELRSISKPVILEIGTSAHTTSLYGPLLSAELNTVCRPPEASGGPTAEWAKKMGSSRHWIVDLNQLSNEGKTVSSIPNGGYDFIVCCEVVEHLLVDPSYILGQFLPKLKQGGVFFLSTPNYFRPDYIEKAIVGLNPALSFEHFHDNVHAHHHFREYTPIELTDCVIKAGGKVDKVVFSKCWDNSARDLPTEIPLRNNLTILIRR